MVLHCSGYINCLSSVNRECYTKRLQASNGLDPYEIDRKSCEKDWNFFPKIGHGDILHYLVYSTNSITLQQMKAFKSLESHNYFASGWVNPLIHLKIINNELKLLLVEIHSRPRIFSGIQPTGAPHLGNYFGAIKKWADLQNAGKDCIFSIVDLHSITIPQDPQKLRDNIHLMTACLLASGIDPDKSIFYLQSQVPQHAELSWILGCLCTMTRLTHQPQFREKKATIKNVPLGLYLYPILQCADILLYKANEVPCGEDQLQHIQLCQHLVKVFNNSYGKVFPTPEASIDITCAKIRSLRNPEKKMSKSDKDFKNRVDLTDSPDLILKRIKEALTDFTSAVTYDPENRPGVSNIILIHSLCTGKSFDKICLENSHLNTGQYKLVVAEAVIEYLKPIQTKIKQLMDNPEYLSHVLNLGSEKAIEIAYKTMAEVKEAVGLGNFDSCKKSVPLKV